MRTFLGVHHRTLARTTALTIGNFDGVHRGHQAILALLRNEANSRGLQSCVLTFEPHPKDYFAKALNKPQIAPARIGTLRDKLTDLASNHIDQTVILPFTAALAARPPRDFVSQVLVKALGARYVLVGDDFRFGKQRAGDYALLDTLGKEMGFEVARMNSYEVHGLRVSSSEVRAALQEGRMQDAARLLGRPYAISGHVIHGRRLGRQLGESASGQGDGFRTLNLHFKHWKPAASGIFIVYVHGLTHLPLPGVANLGIRPSLDPSDLNGGRVLLETHCLEWPETLGTEGAYGKVIRVELLEKLHDEVRYPSISALTAGIAQDCEDARAWFARQAPA
ncbi:bifunctional riboflavin kinase/FAD synthetase [Allofranklinella schreckenbergeri]|uniref:Riboflavin biosynthesis protein n=1 Tax=Allofranklinella schreckenbergeri TaxID=1076744 RepID=A0A3M6PUI8_9BURK|nr:bifunctional riboflavin kinase/FAD synthetase [Allofranklinella schreckenbergeri]RMW94802.1 bifunctional riboflavin kinase/FAD synthetase [Allofranklinella schreckenbergeri]